MTQYCRYCTYMICGDANYCTVKWTTFSDAYICHTNKCKDFEFNEIDALDINHTYTPRESKPKDYSFEQMRLEVSK